MATGAAMVHRVSKWITRKVLLCFGKKAVDVFFPSELGNDFPVAMQVSQRFGVAYAWSRVRDSFINIQ